MQEMLKSHILHLLQKDGTPRKLVHLERELGVGGEIRAEFREALDALCDEGRVIVGRGQVVSLPSLSGEITGIFRANPRGYGFITPEQTDAEDEIFIPAKAIGNAMTGDRVVAEISRRDDSGRLAGKIVKILTRAHTSVVGTLKMEQEGWRVHPDGGDFSHPIQLEGLTPRNVRHGDKVTVNLRAYPTRSQPARGVVADVLGRPGRFDTETAAIIRRHGLLDAFEPAALIEASNAKSGFDPQDVRGRKDISKTLTITIDPPDAKDFDDAVSLTRDRQGRWVLGVHIADVSHFIPAGSALDRSARKRGNSVYLPGCTLPMLPEMLSNGICSLQPGQRRYTKSVYLTYDKDGHVQSSRLANTVIQSRARLSYQEVDRVLKGADCGLDRDVVVLLEEMDALARCIEARRRRAGMLQLESFGTELIRDDSGQVIGVGPEDTCYPHTIIEMFMVEANVAVASLLDRYCVPFIRRIHAEPDAGALNQLSQTLRLLGVTLSRRPSRSDIQAMLDQIRGTRIALPVNMLVLRSLEKAIYGPASVGHYALAASKYCHFTSPIRRYADLTVHHVLGAYLAGDVECARRLYSFSELAKIGEHISETEQVAEEAERELRTIMTLHLLRQRNERELNGVIVGLSPYGAAAFLPDYGVEGQLRRESLGPDQWQYDQRNQCLVGRHTGVLLRLGQAMRLRIVDIHPAAGQLDLTPAVDLIPKTPRQNQQQGGPRTNRSRRRRNRNKRQ